MAGRPNFYQNRWQSHRSDNRKREKAIYYEKKIIPEIPDSVLFEYSKDQLEWMENNEQEMWTFFIKNNFFYTTDDYKIKRLVSPVESTSAGNAGFISGTNRKLYRIQDNSVIYEEKK